LGRSTGFFKAAGIVLMVVTLLTACASGPSHLNLPAGTTLSVTKHAWGHYQKYLANLGGDDSGAFLFAVRDNVAVAGVYSYCPKSADRCVMTEGGSINQANNLCKENQLKCVLFARSRQIVVNYKLVD
jgi:hypothetical protein